MFTIDSTIDIAAPLASVRIAITTEAGYRAWWAQDADFDGTQATRPRMWSTNDAGTLGRTSCAASRAT